MTPKGIIIHHSLTKDGKVEDYASIKRYHMVEKGWEDIGYHFLIERIGDEIVTIPGRDTAVTGAHCVGKNNHIGICVVGNFDTGYEVLSEEKMQALVALCKSMMLMFNLKVNTIHRHSEYAPKSCPGTGFPWSDFISRVSA